MYELHCKRCQSTFPAKSKEWKCRCGSPLNVRHRPPADLSKQTIRFGPPSLWRYREALPITRSESVISFGEGFTPLVESELKGIPVLLKLEYVSPTGSFKDRGMSVMVSKFRDLGVKGVVADSAGKAGASTAAYCGRAGIKCEMYVSAETPKNELLALQACGAKLVRITGEREEAAQAAMAAAEHHYYAGHSWNPYFLEGTKTFAFELWEQLGWREPDVVIIPVGSGTLFLGAYYGFKELLAAHKIRTMPRLFAVQFDLASPVYHSYIRNLERAPRRAGKGGKLSMVAEEARAWLPARSAEIIEAVRDSDGTVMTVTDVEMSEAFRDLGKRGMYVEPTAAAPVAALTKLARIGKLSNQDLVVVPLTGSGLRATELIAKWVSVD